MITAHERLVIASHNQGKVVEIRELLTDFALQIISAADLNLPEPEETGTTFIENAELKARLAAEASGLACLADDSGLEVSCLDGAPGIYSARWGGANKDFNLAMTRIHQEMTQAKEKNSNAEDKARMICVLALAIPNQKEGTVTCHHFYGHIDGHIVWPPRGERGFGYDPIFQPIGDNRSFGEMPPEEKHAMSHRMVAFKALMESGLLPNAR